ncbi:tetratricopeptide repeat protein [Burkholderia sp. L27(2015)]|uniref:tetratricopeptide repeat-containing glycosyltransferase family protein n=1 Tax=Burkholderia sp. L27(2015) TaxID=1641858 RepID=UPI00131C0946|nr:tetratricopeptide repeat-containing glycosyltransferase family protein [Burkholderia sp. L27(2015)]
MSKQINLQRQLDKTLRQAVALQQNAAFVEAEALYREILQLRPNHFDALQLLGTLALQSGRWDEGIALLRKAVAINAMQAPIHSNLAFAYNAVSRFKEGLSSADRAVSLRRDFADAWNNRGNALAGLDTPQDALHSYDRAIALKPDFAQALNNRACVLRDLGRPVDALESCDRAIALWPDYADAWSNRGNALGDLGRPEEARTSYQRAIAIAPNLIDAWNNQGLCLIELNRRDEALLSYQQALSLAPDYAETHWNESLCLLQVGRLEEGWRKYEWRWQRNRIKASRRTFEQPLWLGDEAIAGKTILLHAEQGLGDTLQFCRYVALVAKLGARVVLEVPAELLTLLANLEGVAQIVEQGAPLPPFDYHCPLLSLPLAFNTSVSTIPSGTPYLFADADRVQQWRVRIGSGPDSRLKVGLVWAGGNRAGVAELRNIDARRSIALAQLQPLLDLPSVQYYSLQKGAPAQQLAQLPSEPAGGQAVVDYADELTDFADTAALVENLDLIISVDTSTAHLAGAMGKPVWILNRFDTCWRWMLERDDSPWYPSARLFRQPALGDWGNVIDAVRTALKHRAEAGESIGPAR